MDMQTIIMMCNTNEVSIEKKIKLLREEIELRRNELNTLENGLKLVTHHYEEILVDRGRKLPYV